MMKKCCDKYLVPTIYFRASLIDSVGLIIFLGFILLIAGFFAWVMANWLVSIVENEAFGSRHLYGGRQGGGAIILLYAIYKVLPKVISACSYLVDYQFKITSTCDFCKSQYTFADFPKIKDPF